MPLLHMSCVVRPFPCRSESLQLSRLINRQSLLATDAFDNSGSQYDYEGRFRAWWSNATVSAFQERAQCIAKQYSKSVSPVLAT